MTILFQGVCTYASLEDDFFNEEVIDAFSGKTVAIMDKVPQIEAGAAIAMDAASSRVLFEKNAYSKRAIASTTKIMTAVVALENGNLKDTVTVSKRAAAIRGSTIKLRYNEKLSLRELMYGLLLKSGNDAAIAIAEHIGGSVEKFVDMMNEKAKDLNLKNTNFKTPHGLDADGHYSTAYELALIARYALKNPLFSQIVRTTSASITDRSLNNTNEMLSMYPGADGVKTGYTGKAGRCLVTSATRGSWRVISVVLNCASKTKRTQSSKAVLDYVFTNYKPYKILERSQKFNDISVIKGKKDSVNIIPCEEICIPLNNSELNQMETKISLPQSIAAPIYKDIEVGDIKFITNGKVIAGSSLKTADNVEKKDVYSYISEIIKEWAKIIRF